MTEKKEGQMTIFEGGVLWYIVEKSMDDAVKNGLLSATQPGEDSGPPEPKDKSPQSPDATGGSD